jgi:uncharacterized protein YaiL (DUF2058 family)
MSDSLRDQLLKAGFAPTAKPARGKPRKDAPRNTASHSGIPDKRPGNRPKPPRGERKGKDAKTGEIDLARAWSLRERTEREERAREKREAEARTKEKKERRQKLANLLAGKVLNDKAADIARHFPHGKKISRIWVTAEQLKALNGGELAVVQQQGRFVLVTRETGTAAAAIDPEALALQCEPGDEDDDVPADLVW